MLIGRLPVSITTSEKKDAMGRMMKRFRELMDDPNVKVASASLGASATIGRQYPEIDAVGGYVTRQAGKNMPEDSIMGDFLRLMGWLQIFNGTVGASMQHRHEREQYEIAMRRMMPRDPRNAITNPSGPSEDGTWNPLNFGVQR